MGKRCLGRKSNWVTRGISSPRSGGSTMMQMPLVSLYILAIALPSEFGHLRRHIGSLTPRMAVLDQSRWRIPPVLNWLKLRVWQLPFNDLETLTIGIGRPKEDRAVVTVTPDGIRSKASCYQLGRHGRCIGYGQDDLFA